MVFELIQTWGTVSSEKISFGLNNPIDIETAMSNCNEHSI